jgi:hypothetical protein
MAIANWQTDSQGHDKNQTGVTIKVPMKRLFVFIIVLSLLVVGGTLVSANSQTRRSTSLTDSSIHNKELIRSAQKVSDTSIAN